MNKLYVVMIDGDSAWVLNRDGGTFADCVRAIRWQWKGGNEDRMLICRYDADFGEFVSVESGDKTFPQRGGEHFRPTRLALTREAWAEFLATLPNHKLATD